MHFQDGYVMWPGLGRLLPSRIPEVTGDGTNCLGTHTVPSGFSDRLTFDSGGRKGLGYGQRKISSYFI